MITEERNYPIEKVDRKIVIKTLNDKIILTIHQGKIRVEQEELKEFTLPEPLLIKKSYWQRRKEEKQLSKDLKLAEKKARLEELKERNKLKNIYNENEF